MTVASASVRVGSYLKNIATLDAAGTVSIVDGAASIAAHLDELDSDPQVMLITLSGVGGNVLTLTLSQVLHDARALAALTGRYSIAVTGSAAAIKRGGPAN